MSDTTSVKPSTAYWIVAAIAVLWNLMGVGSYLSFAMMNEATLAEMTEAEQALIANYPFWATAAFAIAVFSGLAGSVLLLVRNRFAKPVFLVSLAAILIQMAWWLGFSGAMEVYGPTSIIMPALVIIVAAFLWWFSMKAKTKGWLK